MKSPTSSLRRSFLVEPLSEKNEALIKGISFIGYETSYVRGLFLSLADDESLASARTQKVQQFIESISFPDGVVVRKEAEPIRRHIEGASVLNLACARQNNVDRFAAALGAQRVVDVGLLLKDAQTMVGDTEVVRFRGDNLEMISQLHRASFQLVLLSGFEYDKHDSRIPDHPVAYMHALAAEMKRVLDPHGALLYYGCNHETGETLRDDFSHTESQFHEVNLWGSASEFLKRNCGFFVRDTVGR